jgi:hypothetical protein
LQYRYPTLLSALNRFNPMQWEDDEGNPLPNAPLISEAPETWPDYADISTQTPTDAIELLVGWFAGVWALNARMHCRRFVVIFSEENKELMEKCAERSQHVTFTTAKGYAEIFGGK